MTGSSNVFMYVFTFYMCHYDINAHTILSEHLNLKQNILMLVEKKNNELRSMKKYTDLEIFEQIFLFVYCRRKFE